MPLYEYRCRACENVFEYIQGLSEGPKRKCESCGGRLEKLVSRTGFVLKGTGWYETDFKSSAPRPTESTEPGGAASGEASSAEDKPKPVKSTTSKAGGDSAGPGKKDKPAGKGGASKPAAKSSGGKG